LLVSEGQRVQPGEVLMRLRQTKQQARLQEAEARLEAQRNTREQRCQQALLYRRDLDRLGQLADRKLIAADRLDQAATKAKLAKLMCSASAVLIREADASLQL